MKELFRKTNVFRAIEASREETFSQSVLVIFPDAVYLRALLKECAKAFFGGSDARVRDLIERESYSDCVFLPEAGKTLSAENCANLSEESLLSPTEGDRKLFVLDAFQLAPPLIQNKLLKILEEPPANAAFLLGSSSESAVLPTVLSRVKKFDAAPFSEEEIASALKRNYPQLSGAEEAAAASGGIYSVAESLLAGGGEDFRLAAEFLSLDDAETFCRKMSDRKDQTEFFAALKAVLRDILFLGAGQAHYVRLKGEEIASLAREYPTGAALKALELCSEAETQIRFHANFANCLYMLALGLKKEKEKWKKLP